MSAWERPNRRPRGPTPAPPLRVKRGANADGFSSEAGPAGPPLAEAHPHPVAAAGHQAPALTTLELAEVLEQEMMENPMLEEVPVQE
jgi:hypothetical protein